MDSTNNYMNQNDIKRIIDTIPELNIRKWDDKDVRFLFKILYYCALRPMEGIMLEKSDFNFNDRYIKLGKTKTDPNAKAVIPMIFVDDLKVYLSAKEEGRLLPNLTYITFYLWLKRLGKMCNIEAWTTPQNVTKEKTVGHIFRKSIGKAFVYGEIRANNGELVHITVISKHMRHKSVSMTNDVYLKVTQEAVKQII